MQNSDFSFRKNGPSTRPQAPLLAALRDDLARDPLLAEFSRGQIENPQIEGAPSLELLSEEKSGPRVGNHVGVSAVSDSSIARSALRNEARAVETEIKFAGYLEQQKKSIAKLKAAEAVAIPGWIEYGAISGLSREMREILERVRPITIGQASRIPGVTPAALSLVHVSIRLQGNKRRATA